MVAMSEIKFSDEKYKKCFALKCAGITVKDHLYGTRTIYDISIADNPNADRFIETSFRSINDILIAFKDRLYNNKFVVKAA